MLNWYAHYYFQLLHKIQSEDWRTAWTDYQNAALESVNHSLRVDHRSYERQGIDKKPTVHLGPAAAQMERKGIRTDRGDINREVEVTNSKLSQQRARIKKAKDWLYVVPIQNAPTMVEMMNRAAESKNFTSRAKRIRNLQTRAKILIFLQQNDIGGIEQLANKVEQMNSRHYEVANEIREVNRRIDTLNLHLAHVENKKKHKGVFQQYRQTKKPKECDAFYAKHEKEIESYKESFDYIKAVLNGKVEQPPVKEWKAELMSKTAERYALCDEYYRLDDDLRSVEALRRGAENIMREDVDKDYPVRTRDLSL